MNTLVLSHHRTMASFRPRRVSRCGVALLLFLSLLSAASADPVTALSFDGMDDVVEISSPPVLGSTFTEEAWILPEPRDDRYHGIVGANAGKVEDRAPGIWLRDRTSIHAGFGSGKQWTSFSSPPNAVVLEAWNHVATTFDGNTYRMYANGIEVATKATTNVPARQPVRRIGRTDYWFPGAIREVRLWNRALSADELRRQINKPLTGTEHGLVAYFRLDEGVGNEARNSVPQGGNGTLLNGPSWITSSTPVAPALLKPRPDAVENYSPTGDNVAPDAVIEIILKEGQTKVDPDSIRLTLDKKAVEPTVTTNDNRSLVIAYEHGDLLEPASTHYVKLSYLVKGATTGTNDLSYSFSISPGIILSK